MFVVLGFLLLVIFLPACFIKNYILYAFVLFYPILPEYFALDLGASLPLLTVSRLLIIVLTFYTFATGKMSCTVKIKNKGKYGALNKCLIFFFVMEIVVALYHFSDSDSMRELLIALLEKAWVFYLLNRLITTREKLTNSVKCLTIASVVMCVGGLLGTLTGENPFYLLSTAARQLTMSSYSRLGVIRAEATFGHPISFSVYLLLVIPFIMYYCDKNKGKKMWLLLLLAIVTLIATISRASLLVFIAIFLVMMKEKQGDVWKKYQRHLFFLSFGVVVLLIFVPDVLDLVGEVFLSLLNIFGAGFELENFGRNSSGIVSRLQQIDLISQVFQNFPLFGGGTNYIYNHEVMIYTGSKFIRATTIDNEYLLTFVDKGLVGLVAKLVLYANIFAVAWKERKKSMLGQAFAYAFLMYFLALLTVCELTSARMLWVIIPMFMVYLQQDVHDLSEDRRSLE